MRIVDVVSTCRYSAATEKSLRKVSGDGRFLFDICVFNVPFVFSGVALLTAGKRNVVGHQRLVCFCFCFSLFVTCAIKL